MRRPVSPVRPPAPRRRPRVVDVIALAVIAGLGLAVVGLLGVVWLITGDPRAGWALGVMVLALVVAYLRLVEDARHVDEAVQR